jgi:multiple sugar transport system permease protein
VINVFLLWAMIFNLVPPVALAGAWYELFRNLGFTNGMLSLILAHTTLHLPMALWLLASFLRDVPRELEEAAQVDGAGFLTLLWHVVVPVVIPGIVATAILVFIFSWNEFPVALALTSNHTATVPVAIAKFAQQNEIKYTQMAAASVLSAIPALLALIFGQRFIVKGLTAGAIK